MAYQLALPLSLSATLDVFHVFMLLRCRSDSSHVIDSKPLSLSDNLSYEEKPVQILSKNRQTLRNREITLCESALAESPVLGSNVEKRERDENQVSRTILGLATFKDESFLWREYCNVKKLR